MSAASSPSAAALPPSQSQSQSVSALLRQIRSAVPLRTHSDFDALFHVRHPGDGTSSSSFSVVVPEQLETEDTQDLTGLHPGHVLHLTGPPGSGKSQLCASFALHLPLDQPGCQVLILDSSDGVLGPQELIRRSSHRFTSEDTRTTLSAIHRMRLTTQAELLAMIYGGLRARLQALPAIKLIIIDSLSALLRASGFVNTEHIQPTRGTASSGLAPSQTSSRGAPQTVGLSSYRQLPNSKTNESRFEQRENALSDLRDLLVRLTSGLNPYTIIFTSQMQSSIAKGSGQASLVSQIAPRWLPPKTFTVLLRSEDQGTSRQRQAWVQCSPYQNHVYPDVTFDIDDGGVVPRGSSRTSTERPLQLPFAASSSQEGRSACLNRVFDTGQEKNERLFV